MATVIAGLLSEAFETLTDMDVIDARVEGGYLYLTLETSGLDESLAEIKAKLWGLLHIPPKEIEVVEVIPLQEGAFIKDFRITARTPVRVLVPKVGKTLLDRKYRLLGRR